MSFIGINRDKDGNVKFIDWVNIAPSFYPHLSEKDWKHIAQKRAELQSS